MTEEAKYFLLGALIIVAVFAVLMPFYRRRGGSYMPVYPVYGPYYAHGGQGYRPGVLY
jgi:hypothetical protein